MNKLKVFFVLLFLVVSKFVYCQDVLSIMQWNVGHFSGGRFPYTTVNDDNYDEKLLKFIETIDDA